MKFFLNKKLKREFDDPFVVKESVSGDAKIGDPSGKHWMEEAFLEKEGVGMQVSSKEPILGLTLSGKRLTAIGAVIAVFFVGLGIRAADLQIIRTDDFKRRAEGNRLRIESIRPSRGVIYDRNGALLVENVPNFSLALIPSHLPAAKEERYAAIARLGELAGIPPTEIEAEISKYSRYSFFPVVIKDRLEYDSVILIQTRLAELPGARIELGAERRYLTGVKSFSHILGYEGRVSPDDLKNLATEGYEPSDRIGRAGVEASYEKELRGIPGRKKVEVDALGREKRIAAKEDPVDGRNLTLSADADLQKFLENALREELAPLGRRKAAGVVLDPESGEILALVSLPAYDNNLFAGGISQDEYARIASDSAHPLLNRAISGLYPAGSTIKPFIALAALGEKLITQNTTFASSGGIAVGDWFFPDWKASGHGATNVIKALAESVNTFFYIIGGGYGNFKGLGIEKIAAHLRSFGFGARLGVDLLGEGRGFLPTPDWKEKNLGEKWYIGDTYNVSIGQGNLLVTPLQIAAGTAAIANGGTLYRPHVLSDKNTQKYILKKDFLSADDVEVARRGMRETVISGSARGLGDLRIQVAGKTGTAQWKKGEPNHGWFTGFGPYGSKSSAPLTSISCYPFSPAGGEESSANTSATRAAIDICKRQNAPRQIVVTILIEAGGEGAVVAVPVAKKVFDWWQKNRM